jgi:hypothetical protein
MFLAYNCSDYGSLLNTSTTNFYLHDDLSNDSTDPTEPMNTTSSTGSLEDVDNDGIPGLTLEYGSYNISKPKQYQEWYSDSFGASFGISGDIKITLWQNATSSINVSVMVRVYDYQSTVFYLHDDGTYDFHDSTDWMNETLPSIERNMGKGPPDGGDFDVDGKRPGLTLIGGGYDADEPMSFQEWNTTVLEDDFIFSGDLNISLWTRANNTADMTLNITLFDYNPTDVTYYLHDDASYDANDATDKMDTTAPTRDRDMTLGPLTGGDYDKDGKEGLTLVSGGYIANQPKQYQDWRTAPFAKRLHIGGDLKIVIWSKSPTANQDMTLRLVLYDYDPGAGTYTELGRDDYNSPTWPTAWTKIEFTISDVETVIERYHTILLRGYRTDVNAEDMFLAYDTLSYPASIDIDPKYTRIGYVTYNDDHWPTNWTEINLTIPNVDYTVPKDDMIVIRATRDDNDNELLFVAYDTQTYDSYLKIMAKAVTQIDDAATNTTTLTLAWTTVNFTIPNINYDIVAGHELMLRLDCSIANTEIADSVSVNIGTETGGSFEDTFTDNGVTHDIEEERTTGNRYHFDVEYRFKTPIAVDKMTGIELGINAWWTDSTVTDRPIVQIYNWNTAVWDTTTIVIDASADGTTYIDDTTANSNHISGTVPGSDLYLRVLSGEEVNFEPVDTVYIDYIYVNFIGGDVFIGYNATTNESTLNASGTIFYLHDDGSNDASDPTDFMNTSASTGSTLQDVDNDVSPGLTLVAGWYDAAYPSQYQDWYSEPPFGSTFTISGDVNITIWARANVSDTEVTLRVRIYDYNPQAIIYYYLYDDSAYNVYDTSDWLNRTTPTIERIMYDAEPDGGDYDCDNRRPGLTLESGGYDTTQPTQYQEFNTSTALEDWWIMEDVEVSLWARAEKEVFMNVTGSFFDVCPTDVTFYLHDDGTYNASDANDTMDETAPTIDRNLNVGPPYGGDYDNDTSSGLTVTDSGYDLGDGTSYQDFYTSAFTNDFEFGGDIKIYLWVMASTSGVDMMVSLYDNGTTGEVLLGTATSTEVPTDWTRLEFTITTQLYTIPAGNCMLLMVDRTDTSTGAYLYLA